MVSPQQQALRDRIRSLQLEASLTPWEEEFLGSVGKQVEGGRGVSEKQEAILQRIEDKVERGGREDGSSSFSKRRRW